MASSPASLRAFDAETLQEIWNSEQIASRDRVGTLMKFVPPVVANGRVYLPNHEKPSPCMACCPADYTVTVTPARNNCFRLAARRRSS